MLKFIKFILIGIIQGVTEVLPVSSSGHLLLAEHFLKLEDIGLTFIVFLHIASLIAVIFFMRKTILRLIKSSYMYLFKRNKEYYNDFKYLLYILASTIPIVIVGPFIRKYVNINSIFVVGILLIINGFMLIFLTRKKENTNNKINLKSALTIGTFQCIGLLPGISRSGSCLCGASLSNLDNETSANYVFLMFIPAVLGAIIFDLNNIKTLLVSSDLFYYVISFIVTLFTTYFSFKLLLKIIKKGKLSYFSVYCFVLGLFLTIYSL